MTSPTVLLEEVNPNGNVQALVEQDERVAYLYLYSAPETGLPRVRSCWVRNLTPAPAELDVEALRRGQPPALLRDACAHPAGAPPLAAERLRLVWTEAGDGAALLDGDELLAVLPPLADADGACGCARDCTDVSAVVSPLAPRRDLVEQVERAATSWAEWDGEAGAGAWPPLRDGLVAAYREAIGEASNYYAMDGGEWPPRALLRIPAPGGTALVTAGVCVRPQPGAGDRAVARVELGLCLGEGAKDPDVQRVMRYLSARSGYPWERYAWLGEGHTLPCDSIKGFPSLLLTRTPAGAPPVKLPAYRGDPVNLLWLVPITAAEQAVAEARGGPELASLLAAAGHGWIHRPRPCTAGTPEAKRRPAGGKAKPKRRPSR